MKILDKQMYGIGFVLIVFIGLVYISTISNEISPFGDIEVIQNGATVTDVHILDTSTSSTKQVMISVYVPDSVYYNYCVLSPSGKSISSYSTYTQGAPKGLYGICTQDVPKNFGTQLTLDCSEVGTYYVSLGKVDYINNIPILLYGDTFSFELQ